MVHFNKVYIRISGNLEEIGEENEKKGLIQLQKSQVFFKYFAVELKSVHFYTL